MNNNCSNNNNNVEITMVDIKSAIQRFIQVCDQNRVGKPFIDNKVINTDIMVDFIAREHNNKNRAGECMDHEEDPDDLGIALSINPIDGIILLNQKDKNRAGECMDHEEDPDDLGIALSIDSIDRNRNGECMDHEEDPDDLGIALSGGHGSMMIPVPMISVC